MALLIVVSSLVNFFRFSAGVGIGLFCSSGLFSDPSLSQLAGFWSGLFLVFVSLDVHVSLSQVVLLVAWVAVTFFADFYRETPTPKAPRWLFDVLRRARWWTRMWKQKTWYLIYYWICFSADLHLCNVLIVETDRLAHMTTIQVRTFIWAWTLCPPMSP